MAQPVLTVAEYLGLLGRSRLLPDETIQSVHKAWAGEPTDVEGFRKSLVAGKHLTEYQSMMLKRGHAGGFHLGGYVIQERIGKGSSAGVYLGKHPSGQIVALKVLPGSKARNANMLARFRREGRLLTQLNHPNIVRAFQIGSMGETNFIVMEHLVGDTLEDILTRRNRLPVAESCRLCVQLLEGLNHLHENRMIHRDIKPMNIMITSESTATTLQSTLKLLDIGLGREIFADDEGPQDANLTKIGAILGTPDYLAPEQARDARASDIRSDIYSAGCVLYRLITGRTPFTGTNVMDQMIQHATEHATRLNFFVPDAPASLQIVMDRLLAKDPADRFQTPADALTAMRAFLPETNTLPQGTHVLPAYQEWLNVESNREMPAVPPPPSGGGFQVEVVAMPPTGTQNKWQSSEPDSKVARSSPRGWFDFSTRDWAMLAIGFLLSCVAIGGGYGLSLWLKSR